MIKRVFGDSALLEQHPLMAARFEPNRALVPLISTLFNKEYNNGQV